MADEPVVVVGAGVSGLTTAILLVEAGRRVRVWSSLPPEETTSVVASALWGPSFQQPLDKTLEWTKESLRVFTELASDADTGVRLAPMITVGDIPDAGELPPQVRMIPDLRPCDPAELPDGYASGSRSTMPLIDMPRYLAYLRRRLEPTGTVIELRRLGALGEAAAESTTVVNCTGLGARRLVDDAELHPVFGQHVEVTNPGLHEAFMELSTGPAWTGWYPHHDRVVCGGVSLPGHWDPDPLPEITDQILERCRALEPRLRDTEVVRVRAGLRPDRPAVRVTAEHMNGVTYVHNYGHGGSGVSLSWGCAREAAALALG